MTISLHTSPVFKRCNWQRLHSDRMLLRDSPISSTYACAQQRATHKYAVKKLLSLSSEAGIWLYCQSYNNQRSELARPCSRILTLNLYIPVYSDSRFKFDPVSAHFSFWQPHLLCHISLTGLFFPQDYDIMETESFFDEALKEAGFSSKSIICAGSKGLQSNVVVFKQWIICQPFSEIVRSFPKLLETFCSMFTSCMPYVPCECFVSSCEDLSTSMSMNESTLSWTFLFIFR